jgi:hypothetical protein
MRVKVAFDASVMALATNRLLGLVLLVLAANSQHKEKTEAATILNVHGCAMMHITSGSQNPVRHF